MANTFLENVRNCAVHTCVVWYMQAHNILYNEIDRVLTLPGQTVCLASLHWFGYEQFTNRYTSTVQCFDILFKE